MIMPVYRVQPLLRRETTQQGGEHQQTCLESPCLFVLCSDVVNSKLVRRAIGNRLAVILVCLVLPMSNFLSEAYSSSFSRPSSFYHSISYMPAAYVLACPTAPSLLPS